MLYHRSGELDVPTGPAGFFSKNNWQDHVERRDGRDVLVKTTTGLVKLVKKLRDVQWEKIIRGAKDLAKVKKQEVVEKPIQVVDSSDYEIIDGDRDLIASGGEDSDLD